MNEISGSVPNRINENVQKPIELSVQRSDQPITCTAHALVNGLRMRGAVVTSSEDRSLVQQTLDKKAPLSPENTIKPFGLAHGYALEQWRLGADKITSPESIGIQFAARLETTGPAMISIASALSKRDRTVAATVSFDENPELQGKTVVHRVVAAREGNMVNVIDSYAPNYPESFDMSNSAEQRRLAMWLMSAGIHSNLPDSSQLDKDQTVEQLNEWVANKFDPFRAMGHIISTADVENFIPVNS